jgi:hypothetical protein
MREFAFFGTWDDSWAMLDAIEQLGMFWMVPDRWYEQPEPLVYKHVDDSLKEMLRAVDAAFRQPAVYLCSNSYCLLATNGTEYGTLGRAI